MKLKLLREHYVRGDIGGTWIPKTSFDTEEEVKEAGFFPNKWHTYVCGFCGKLHNAKIKKEST